MGQRVSSWSTTAASNNAASPDGWPEGMPPSGVNDTGRENMAAVREWLEDGGWFERGDAHTRTSGTTTTTTGDQRTAYHANRRIRAIGVSTGTIYGYVSDVTFTTNTQVTFAWDSGSLSNESLTIAVSILDASGPLIQLGGVAGAGTAASLDTGTSTANLPTVGDIVGRQTVFVPARAMVLPTTTPATSIADAETTTNDVVLSALGFTFDSTTHAQFSFPAPKSADESGTLVAQIVWKEGTATTTAHDVGWTIEAQAQGSGDALDSAWGTAITLTSTGAASQRIITPDTAAITPGGTWAEGDDLLFRIGRLGGSDGASFTAELLGVRVFFNTNALNDA